MLVTFVVGSNLRVEPVNKVMHDLIRAIIENGQKFISSVVQQIEVDFDGASAVTVKAKA